MNDKRKASTDADEALAKSLREQVQELRLSISTKALGLVHIVMPQKVLQLSATFKENHSLNLPLEQVHQNIHINIEDEAKNKKRKLNDTESSSSFSDASPVPSNKVILDLLALLKKEVLELIETINTVKIWIQLNIPKIEDGNNFGVSIQEETVSELGRAEDSGFSVLESMTKYFITRAKLVSKILKYPKVEDYRQSVIELDEKEFVNLKLCCLDLRNNYSILYDMITKNLEKIRTPRSSNHSATMF